MFLLLKHGCHRQYSSPFGLYLDSPHQTWIALPRAVRNTHLFPLWSMVTQSYRKLISHLENPVNSLIGRKRNFIFVISIFESIFMHVFLIHYLSVVDKKTFPSL